MAEAAKTERFYFHPTRGWGSDSAGAVLRLDATALERRVVDARNVLFAPDEKGGWRAVTNEGTLDAVARGLTWETWQTAVDGEEYLAFRGLRVVDDELAQGLLQDLALRDEEGLLATEPRRLGRIFLLDSASATEFARRVKAAGGRLGWGSPLPQESADALARLQGLADRVGQERRLDAEAMQAARTGNLSVAAGFEARSADFLALCADVAEAYAACRRQLQHLLSQGKTAPEREQAAARLQEARTLREQATVAREERDEDAAELALRAGQAAGRVPPALPTQLRVTVQAVARLAEAAGYPVTVDGEERVIELPEGTLRLGVELRVATKAAERLTGPSPTRSG